MSGEAKQLKIIEKEKKYPDKPGQLTEERLLPQLGASPKRMMETMEYDERIQSNITKEESYWITECYLLSDEAENKEFYPSLAEIHLAVTRSVNGWTSNNELKAAKATGGSPAAPSDRAVKPGFIGRNLTNRKWKEKAMAKGEEVEEE